MGYSIADAVTEILSEMNVLHPAFRYNVVNYSALARLLKPIVDTKVGSSAGLDAIVMGIRRYAEGMTFAEKQQDIIEIIKECTMTLRTDMASASVKYWRTPEFLSGLYELDRNVVDWHAGEKIYMTRRSYEMTLVFSSKFMPQIVELVKTAPTTELMEKREGLALISVSLPPMAFNVPGVFSFFTDKFTQANINVLTVFSTYRMMSFLFNGKDAPKAYERISSAILSCQALYERLQDSADNEPESTANTIPALAAMPRK